MELKIASRSILAKEFRQYRLRFHRALIAIAGFSLALLSVILISSAFGSTYIPFQSVLDLLIPFFNSENIYSTSISTIVLHVRLPRIIMAGLVGAALGTAGAAYQGIFRNPLADPYLTGISQGAALGAVIGFILPYNIPAALIPALSFTGAVLCVFTVYSIARVGPTLPMTTLILAGVAIGAFLAAITSYLIIISGDRAHGIIFWLLGTFSLADWWQVFIMTPYILLGIVIICLYARPLNVMQLDEDQARQLGINTEKVKLIILCSATVATAAAVCFCGIIGFIGIIVPHLVRILFGPDYRLLLPLSALTGAIFLISADTISRTVLAPSEIPVGIITAIIGVPFFLYVLRTRKKAVF